MKRTILKVLNTAFIVGGARRRHSRPRAERSRHSHWQTATELWFSHQEIGRQLYDKADFQRACQAFLWDFVGRGRVPLANPPMPSTVSGGGNLDGRIALILVAVLFPGPSLGRDFGKVDR